MNENPPYTIHGYQYTSRVSYSGHNTLQDALRQAAVAVDWSTYWPTCITDKDGDTVLMGEELEERIHEILGD
jgi:hypothetical protein